MEILLWKKSNKDFNNVPESQGVYIIACHCVDGKNIVIYTGQSTNLNKRLKEHWSDSEKNEDLKAAIANYPDAINAYYAIVQKKGELDGIERYLFDSYMPQCTERAPDVSPIKCLLSSDVVKGQVELK